MGIRHLSVRITATVLLVSALCMTSPVAFAAPPAAAEGTTYVVLYSESGVPGDAPASIARAGGNLVYSYDEIGVAIVASTDPSFRANVLTDSRVEGAAPTALGAVRLKDRDLEREMDAAEARGAATAPLPGAGPHNLVGRQWDMEQIRAPAAHEHNRGSRSVVVGNIDTGIDYKHPDLKPNIDFDNSVSCIGGKPDQSPSKWNDDNGHGTHTAGIIAASDTGPGIVGVAPNVRIATIKAATPDGFFFPETVVCAFVWAGTHHINVTNNSYFADPWYYNCPAELGNDEQRAILTAEMRAIRFAQNRGVSVVVSAGNFADNLANPTQDRQSPDDNRGAVTRPVDRSCKILPLEAPGVIGVSATGNQRQKSYYSNYGLPFVHVAAPGGDRKLQLTGEGGGRVLSTWPSNLPPQDDCPARLKVVLQTGDPDAPTAAYCYLQGTSMAAPHAAGVAALIASRFSDLRDAQGTNGQNASPDSVRSWLRSPMLKTLLIQSTEPIACPTKAVLDTYVIQKSVNNDELQTCSGPLDTNPTLENNSWYGHGEINALKAVTRPRGGD